MALSREVEHIDVVDDSADVLKLVATYFTDRRVSFHHADAYQHRFPVGTRCDIAWHDIWDDLNEDNLPLMAKLNRRYAKAVRWQGSWGMEFLRRERRRDKRMSF